MHITEINLNDLVKGSADLVVVLAGEESKFLFSSDIEVNMDQICNIYESLNFLCDIFDGNNHFAATIRGYASSRGVGFAVIGFARLVLKGEEVAQLLNIQIPPIEFNFEFSLEFENNVANACTKIDGEVVCTAKCTSDSECIDTHFCNIFGVCSEKLAINDVCLDNGDCKVSQPDLI